MVQMRDVLAKLGEKDVKHIVSVSGGKDSAALAIYMHNKYPQIPVEYVFCDTGCELPETYEYLERMEALLGKKVIRLSALDTLNIANKPGRNPFDIWLNEVYGGFLPNHRSRWCTRVLKIQPFENYVGDGHAYSYIGIRGDEDRDGYIAKKPPSISDRPNITPVYPFKDDNLGIADIRKILTESGLGMPEYYRWRSRSGCYFCFYQQIGEWQRLKKEHPSLFEKAKTYEVKFNGKHYSWVPGKTLEDIEQLRKDYPLPVAGEGDSCAVCHL